MNEKINKFLDPQSKIKIWPAKHEMKLEILRYLAEKFEYERFYTEKEVNRIIESWHTFGDFFLLRRGLIDYHFLGRTPDGYRYWREENIL